MADIAISLLWHKLGEVGEKMAEAGRTWYTELDFDSYVLDLILLGWCSLCITVMITANAIASALGPLQKKAQDKGVDLSSNDQGSASLPIETCQWFNNAINWFYLHYYHAPEFLNEWVLSLNQELVKLGGPVPAKIEQIQNGSLPPKFTHVSCEASPKDKFIIHARIESRDLAFQLFASQQTQQGVKLTNCTASVLRLKGTLRVESYREGVDVKVKVNFEDKPEIKLLVKPNNPYQDENELVDLGVVEENIRHAIGLSKTVFTVTHLLMNGDLQTVGHGTKFEGYAGIQGHSQGSDDRSSVKKSAPTKLSQPLATSTPVPASTPTSIDAVSIAAPPMKQQQQQKQQQQKQQQQQHKQQQQQHPQQRQEKLIQTQQHPVEESIIPTSVELQRSAPPQTRQEVNQNFHSASEQQLYQEDKQLQQLQQLRQLQQHQQQQAVQRREQQRVKPQSRPEGVFEPVEAAHLQSAYFSAPPKPPRMVGDKRLLVKVIKANGLTLQELGPSSAVCMVSTDEPVQGYGTSVVKNTCHPFWDEHFLFDITHDTQEVHVEIYDTSKPPGDDFIGESIVYVDDLRKNPSSRQILRLHPDPQSQEYNSGSVTAEFLFMDPNEADLLLDSMSQQAAAQLSPRRRIEIERSAAPGGTLITTTTTTERSPFGRHEPGLDGSPNYIEKNVLGDDSMRFSYNDSSSNVSSETIPINGVGSISNNSISATALREITSRSSSRLGKAKSGTVTITGVRRTVEGPPEDDLDTSRTYGGQGQEKEKKKGSFGSALRKRFGRKKRAQSADRTLASSSMREGSYLRPPEPSYGPKSKDDLELVRRKQEPPPSPTLKKTRTLGGSLKKLFRRGRKRSQGRGEDNSRDSSLSRGSHQRGGGSKGPSRDNSLTRPLDQRAYERASSVS